MTHQMNLTIAEIEISITALEILQPDDAAAQEYATEFEVELRGKFEEYHPDLRESIKAREDAGGAIEDVLIVADAEQWEALADGLDIIQPEEEEAADIANALAIRIREMTYSPSPA